MLKTQAIVLKKKQLLGKDTLLTFFTSELGKVTVIAKGIKSITSRRAPHIQTANLIECILSDKSDRYYLQQTQLISAFSQVKKSEQKVNFTYAFFFILDRILPEKQPEPEMFTLTKSFLIELSKKEQFNQKDFAQYLYRTLSLLGYVHEPQSLLELVRITEELINEKIPLRLG